MTDAVTITRTVWTDAAPKPAPAPWYLVRNHMVPGVRTYFRKREDADAWREGLTQRFGERIDRTTKRIGPRVEIVYALP